MRLALSVFAVSLLFAGAALADDPAPAPAEPFQVVRTGDRDMNCDQLAAEINSLAAAPAEAPKKKKGFGLGSAMGAAMGQQALGMVGWRGGYGGAVAASAASQALGAGAAAAQQQDAVDQMTDAQIAAQQSQLKMQRSQRLQTIFDEKKC